MNETNKTNKTIAESLGWRRISEHKGKLIGLCPESLPWPNKGCFNCPKEVPNYEAICRSHPPEKYLTT